MSDVTTGSDRQFTSRGEANNQKGSGGREATNYTYKHAKNKEEVKMNKIENLLRGTMDFPRKVGGVTPSSRPSKSASSTIERERHQAKLRSQIKSNQYSVKQRLGRLLEESSVDKTLALLLNVPLGGTDTISCAGRGRKVEKLKVKGSGENGPVPEEVPFRIVSAAEVVSPSTDHGEDLFTFSDGSSSEASPTHAPVRLDKTTIIHHNINGKLRASNVSDMLRSSKDKRKKGTKS